VRRLAAVLLLVLSGLVLAGCEDAQQSDARNVLQAYLRRLPDDGGYRVDDVHCTHAARVILDPVHTTRFYCSARRAQGGDCDLFRVDARKTGQAVIALVRRGAGCVLPVG
jgi:hypothetical protein